MKSKLALLCPLFSFFTLQAHASTVTVLSLGFNCQPAVSDNVCLGSDKQNKNIQTVTSVKLVNKAHYNDSFGGQVEVSPAVVVKYDGRSIILAKESATRLGLSIGELMSELRSQNTHLILRQKEDSGQEGLLLSIEQ